MHVVNVCNNNFHLHRFQPRGRYSNLLKVPDFPKYVDTPEGLRMLDYFERFARQQAGQKYPRRILKAVNHARAKLRKTLAESPQE